MMRDPEGTPAAAASGPRSDGPAAEPGGRRIDRVLLVYPAARRYSGFLSTNRYPFLYTAHAGLPILAEILERKGTRTSVVDDLITPLADSDIRDASLVGVSIQTRWAERGYEIAARSRALGVPVVLGGAHATLVPDEALDHADLVVRNEGEETLPALVEALRAGAPLDGIAGLSFRRSDGTKVHNPERPLLTTAELDAAPWADFGRIRGWGSPLNTVGQSIYFTMVSRGCPFDCTFCSITREFGKAYRHRSVGNVIDELKDRFDPERQFLFFMDDSLSGDKEYLKDLLAALIRHDLVPRLGWHSQMRADTARDKDLCRLMERTNCFFATFGFESIEESTLKYMRKGQSLGLIEECIRTMQEHDVLVNGFFMFGSDHDTVETIHRTVEFARANCALAGFMPMTPFPGTAFYEDLDRQGRIFTRRWELFDVQHVVYFPKRMSPRDLYVGCLDAYRRFYADVPSFIATKLRRALPRLWRAVRPWDPRVYLRRETYLWGFVGLWPYFKLVDVAKEYAANLDYLAYLDALDPASPKEFEPRGAWLQDALNWRSVKRLLRSPWSVVAGSAASATP